MKSEKVSLVRWSDGRQARAQDIVASEAPLEIRLGDVPLAVVMRTPGDDLDLVRGFFITEAILLDPSEISQIDPMDESRLNVTLKEGIDVDPTQFQRNMFASSSCGVCGKASIEQVRLFARSARPFSIEPSVLGEMTGKLREFQPTFDDTGGLHAAGVFSVEGKIFAIKEDVGRHNAVDKAIGSAAQLQWPLPPSVLVVSGRQSFEIIQKAALAGIGAVVGVSAPSSLAVQLAQELDMLLVGFARGEGFNVYSGEQHVRSD
ncbi:MAG: formate dehydrogenase accessory sulfurtransferase FdhD [Gemmatimonadota bacterium]|nr:formate dehydrogenase accessory sulfurtransferase FdhD [Gemmatimonadota bacterium]